MKRPLFISFIFLLIGIIVGKYNILHPIVPLSFIVLVCIFIYDKYRTKSVFIFIAFSIIGYVRIQSSLGVQNNYIDNYVKENRTFIIDGQVIDTSFTSNGRQRITLSTHAFYIENKTFIENMLIQAILEHDVKVNIGDKITLQGQLLQLNGIRNPGGFNQFLFLRTRKIQYTMFPQVISHIETVENLQTFLHSTRNKLINVFDTVLPKAESGIIRSMVVGDRSNLDEDIVDLYRISGMYHILVISGLHISILMAALNKGLEKFLSVKLSAIITLIFLVFYSMLVGNGVSVVRAVTMAGVFIVGKIIYRERDFITSISFAAICLLLYEPLYLWDIGFQFSFVAVFGIAVATEPIDRAIWILFRNLDFLQPLFNKHKFRKSFAVNVAVFLSISPISVYHFYFFMPYSIIANIIIIFTANLVVVLGFTIGIVGLINLKIAEILAGGLFVLLKVYEKVATLFSGLPYSSILIGQPPKLLIVGYYIVFISLIYMLSAFGNKYKIRKKYFLFSFSLYIILIIINNIKYTSLEVAFLDVGQGESIVINSNNEVYIIDGGGVRNREIGENMGINVLIPFLNNRGIRNIDKVFVTHEDADHIIGIIEIIGKKNIGEILTTFAIDRENELFLMLEHLANKYNVPISFIGESYSFKSKDGIYIDVLYPFYDKTFRNPNDTSLVLMVNYRGIDFLLTADIDKQTEYEIIDRGKNVSAHVLNIAHHGSRFSTSQRFLDEVSPIIGVVSAGRNNVFGHPTREVVEKLENANIPLYSTIDSGAVIIRTSGEIITVIETFN